MNRYRYISNVEFPRQASANHREVVLAARGIQVSRLAQEQVLELVLELVCNSTRRTGAYQRLFLDDLAGAIVLIVQRDFLDFSVEDLRLAFREGNSGGASTGSPLHAQTIFTWLKRYQRQRTRILEEQASYEFSLSKEREKLAHQQRAANLHLLRKRLLHEYEEFVSTDNYEIQDYGNVRYDLLDELQLIPFDNQRKKEFIAKAREVYFTDLKTQQRKASGSERERLVDMLRQRRCDKHTVVSVAKKLALKSYFRELKQTCANLEQLIQTSERVVNPGVSRY